MIGDVGVIKAAVIVRGLRVIRNENTAMILTNAYDLIEVESSSVYAMDMTKHAKNPFIFNWTSETENHLIFMLL